MVEFYRNFPFGMKKGADAPFSFEIAISSEIFAYAAAFFLPTNLPINGQKRSNKAKDVMPPTNGLEKKISKLPCENNMDWRKESSARSPNTKAKTIGAIG